MDKTGLKLVNSRPAEALFGVSMAGQDTDSFNESSQIMLNFNDFHRDMFDQKVKKADMRAVFTEYAWDLKRYDPCAADPLNPEELQSLGVLRLTETPPDLVPGRGPRHLLPPMNGVRDIYVTTDKESQAHQLAELTGGKLAAIHQEINLRNTDTSDGCQCWQNLWTS